MRYVFLILKEFVLNQELANFGKGPSVNIVASHAITTIQLCLESTKAATEDA